MKHLTPHQMSGVRNRCLEHLDHEEQVLNRSLECLHDIRTALLAGDLTKLREAVEQQSVIESDVREIDEHRKQFQEEIASTSGLAKEDVTVQRVAQLVADETCNEMLEHRDRLSRMALEAAQLNRGNHALINSSLDLMQNLFEKITGQLPPAGRYEASGAMTDVGQQSILSRKY